MHHFWRVIQQKALEDGQHITAIINGEYYDIKPGKDEK